MKKKIAINGFGRIGRNFLRLSLSNPDIEVVAVNDIAPLDIMIHLLKYDSIHGVLKEIVNHTENSFEINNTKVKYFSEKDPINLPWSELDVDIVVEATGLFKTKELANKHIIAGAKKVVITAPPADDSIKTIVFGVNEHLLAKNDFIVSNASCTTNNAAPMIKVIDANFSIESAYITTIHSFTTDQRLHDSPHIDFRRARAANSSIVPTTTGAAKAVTKVFPHLDGIIGGCGMRVPVSNGSLTDITFVISEQTSIEEVNQLFIDSSNGSLKDVMFYNNDPIVSVDVIGNPYSCVFDSELTSVIGKMVKVVGWYDNEIGYSNRLSDLIKLF
ncbi:type I glyceraldehyde-3-phosphate dehydrogenase [Flavobacteriales bacterium]|nr:type I glyceraldehyde-3-phosphate dehydrogenase [Flavobacteriales bacterium]